MASIRAAISPSAVSSSLASSRANIERQLAQRRDHVDGARGDLQLADGAHQTGHLQTALFDHADHLRGSGSRVVAQRHRHRAGMAGDAAHGHTPARKARDGADHPNRQVLMQQHRALLDMDFDIADELVAARQRGDARGSAAPLTQYVRETLSRRITPLEHVGVEPAGHRGASKIRGGEAHALLLREADDVQMKRQRDVPPPQLLDGDDTGENAEPSVIFPRVADGIVVRSDDQRPCIGARAWIAANDVARHVDMRGHAGSGHPFAQFSGSRAMRGRHEGAGQAVGAFRKSGQPMGQGQDTRAERVACCGERTSSLALRRIRQHLKDSPRAGRT